VILLTIRFFATFAAETPQTWAQFATAQSITLAGLIAGPVLLMTIVLTRNPRATLLLQRTSGKAILLAFLLALTIHPVAMLVAEGITRLYPVNPEVIRQMEGIREIIASAPSLWYIVGLLALTPAICEELAFRGFVLSGLRHMGSKWGAILISSAFFGITHGILQQSISAALVGVVLAVLAVQTGSLLACIVFHCTYNTLGLASFLGFASVVRGTPWLGMLFEVEGHATSYRWPLILVGAVLSIAILNWFRQLPHRVTPEEALHDVLSHQSAGAAAS
jgi:sodium transport system permease protein